MDASSESAAGDGRSAAERPAAGWYASDDPPYRVRWWDGDQWVGESLVPQVGWHESTDDPAVRRFWNGAAWTTMRRRASKRVFRQMLLLSAAGIGLVVWGWMLAKELPAWSYPAEMSDYYCSGEHDAELGPSWQLWAVWMALALVSTTAWVLWARDGRGDRRMFWLARLGVLSAVGLFPVWLALGAAANCGL